MMIRLSLLILAISTCSLAAEEPTEPNRLRLGIAGLTHNHVLSLLGRYPDDPHAEIVGIAESDQKLVAEYGKMFNLEKALFYPDLESLLKSAKPEAVVAFNSTAEHLPTVELCATQGVDVMVEKPLALSFEEGLWMKQAAEEGQIDVLVNYETTWSANFHTMRAEAQSGLFGEVRKVSVRIGHPGPIEIGCNPEFVEWLTDPAKNGGGAVVDMGCYGANLATWIMGEKPISVTALTQQISPTLYPNVDDEATILLAYPKAQVIIEASWNWSDSRKDLEIHGATGYALSEGQRVIRSKDAENAFRRRAADPLEVPLHDPIAYLAAVSRGEVEPDEPSSLDINLVVMEILDAARESASRQKTVHLE